MSRKKIIVSFAIAVLFAFAGGGPAFAVDNGRLSVAVSIAPQAWFVERIGGEKVSVRVIMPPFADHDTFEPTPKQLVALSTADLFIKIGIAHFVFEEKYVEPVIRKGKAGRIASMSEGIPLLADDPHVWIAPHTVKTAARNIYRALVSARPADAAVFSRNFDSLLREIDAAEIYVRKALAGREGCCFIIYHPALGYLADRYGLRQIVIESEGKSPSALHFRNIVDEARKKKLTGVLVQKGFDHKSARAIAQEIGAGLVEIDPMEKNWPKNIRVIADKLQKVSGK